MNRSVCNRVHLSAAVFVITAILGSDSFAAIQVYSDKTNFLSDTNATDATPSMTTLSAVQTSLTIDGVTVSSPAVENIFAQDWTNLLSGNELAVSEKEDFDIGLPGPVYSLGFDIVEPSGSPSSFTGSLFLGLSPVGTFAFDPPDDLAAFVGVWSSLPFDRFEIRETTIINQDEYLGHIYSGLTVAPEPASSVLVSIATVFGLACYRIKRRVSGK